MKLLLLVVVVEFFLFSFMNAGAQNIVPNSSFEMYSQHDNDGLDLKYCPGWLYSIQANNSSTPDHIIASDTAFYPLSSQGKTNAHNGNCFAGFTTNEFLICRFDNKMIKDSLYRISFWFSLTPNADYYSSCFYYSFLSEKSFAFCNPKLTDYKRKQLFDSIPDNMNQMPYSSGLARKWQLLQFEYSATGEETGLTLGIRHDSQNKANKNICVQLCPDSRMKLNNGNVTLKQLYYYVDDVSVSMINTPLPIGKSITATEVLFETNGSTLDPKSQHYISEIAAYLLVRTDLVITVSGYTDNVGTEQRNLELSLARAESVKQALMSLGVSADRIIVKGLGSQSPVESNSTSEGRAKNRRIELLIEQMSR